jgi:hypothetical protein
LARRGRASAIGFVIRNARPEAKGSRTRTVAAMVPIVNRSSRLPLLIHDPETDGQVTVGRPRGKLLRNYYKVASKPKKPRILREKTSFFDLENVAWAAIGER